MAKLACIDDAFSEVFERETSPLEDQSLQQKGKERRKSKSKKIRKNKKSEKPKDVGHFLPKNSQNFDFYINMTASLNFH